MGAFRHTDIREAVRDALIARGCTPPESLPAGRWIRLAAPDKRPGNDAIGVKIADDERVAFIKNFIDGGPAEPVFADRPENQAERLRQQDAARRARAKRKADGKARQAVALAECDRIWSEAVECDGTAYTRRKGLTGAHDARWHARRGCLIVRYVDTDGNTRTLQRINDDGGKRCWPGAPVKGAFVLLGTLDEATPTVLVTEGFATAATLREETEHTVVGAMFAGNLLAVCKALRARYPGLAITVAGDDDRGTAGNPGRTKAIEAAEAVGGLVLMPAFCASCDGRCSDHNDVALCHRGRA